MTIINYLSVFGPLTGKNVMVQKFTLMHAIQVLSSMHIDSLTTVPYILKVILTVCAYQVAKATRDISDKVRYRSFTDIGDVR